MISSSRYTGHVSTGMDIILSGVKWNRFLVYFENFVVFSNTMEEHTQLEDGVLAQLRDAGVTLRLLKCDLFQYSVQYLRHEITSGKLGVLEANTRT